MVPVGSIAATIRSTSSRLHPPVEIIMGLPHWATYSISGMFAPSDTTISGSTGTPSGRLQTPKAVVKGGWAWMTALQDQRRAIGNENIVNTIMVTAEVLGHQELKRMALPRPSVLGAAVGVTPETGDTAVCRD